MKKSYLMALAVAFTMTACEKPISVEEGNESPSEVTLPDGTVAKTKKFTFTLKGDFTSEWKPVTRGYLAADGKDLTDVWVLDYMNGNLVQQIHQDDNTAEDFGKPVMQLAYGDHHIYFVASRGQGADLDTDAKTITFSKVLDTFYKDYEVNVVSTSNGNRAVTLDRCVTRLRLTFTDAVATNTATIAIAPGTWYYGINYATGLPVAAKSSQASSINVPVSELGKAGLQCNLFGFSTADEWSTDVVITSRDADGNTIGEATLIAAPFKANRISEYSGPLFGSEGDMSLSLNTSWDEAFEGTW
jgi:hypothetical protein